MKNVPIYDIAWLKDMQPGDVLPDYDARILKVDEKEGIVYVRKGRNVLEMKIEEFKSTRLRYLPAVKADLYKIPGLVYHYDYCRGNEYIGIGHLRGKEDHEFWMKTIKGENHFNNHSNFVIFNDAKLTILTPEEDLELGNF